MWQQPLYPTQGFAPSTHTLRGTLTSKMTKSSLGGSVCSGTWRLISERFWFLVGLMTEEPQQGLTSSHFLCVCVEVCAISLSTPCHCFTCSGISTPCQLQLFLQSWGVARRLAQVAQGHQCARDHSQISIYVQPNISSNVMIFVGCAIWNK